MKRFRHLREALKSVYDKKMGKIRIQIFKDSNDSRLPFTVKIDGDEMDMGFETLATARKVAIMTAKELG
jgi:hypothetical protein